MRCVLISHCYQEIPSHFLLYLHLKKKNQKKNPVGVASRDLLEASSSNITFLLLWMHHVLLFSCNRWIKYVPFLIHMHGTRCERKYKILIWNYKCEGLRPPFSCLFVTLVVSSLSLTFILSVNLLQLILLFLTRRAASWPQRSDNHMLCTMPCSNPWSSEGSLV